MFIVVAIMKVQEGKEQEMKDAMSSMLPQVQSEEGTLVYALHQSQKEPQKFLVYEQYRDKEAFDFHSTTDAIKELFGKVGPLLDGKPSIEMYDLFASK